MQQIATKIVERAGSNSRRNVERTLVDVLNGLNSAGGSRHVEPRNRRVLRPGPDVEYDKLLGTARRRQKSATTSGAFPSADVDDRH
jgi:hypothetical protein